jgi:NADP-dependent 3-hydroxy acid dehydrogenase YdfG
MGKLQNRIAVITGASTGIGKSIAVAYAAEGAKIVLASRNAEKLELVAKEILSAGEHALCRPGMKNYFIPFVFKRRPILPG